MQNSNLIQSVRELRQSILRLSMLPFEHVRVVFEEVEKQLAELDNSPQEELVLQTTKLTMLPLEQLRKMLDELIEAQQRAEEAYMEMISRCL